MAEHTTIQWCDGTVNPVAGCDGCELFETREQVVARIAKALPGGPKDARKKVAGIAERFVGETPLKASRSLIDTLLLEELIGAAQAAALHAETKSAFKCYAAQLSERYAGKAGWPAAFDKPKLFAGRIAKAAALKDMVGKVRDDKPWLNGQPRSMFVSDMGDALSAGIEFEFLRDEIITNVTSENGKRHVWLWVTKRPKQMAKFASWLAEKGIPWPDNLVAMTTVTSADTPYRVNDLREVPAKMRGLSVEPLWEEITLDLTGIDWVIVGGESGASAEPFHVEWAEKLREQCREAGVAFFFKQLGSKPYYHGEPLKMKDPHGGDWDEWLEVAWKVREAPDFSKLIAAPVIEVNSLTPEDLDYRACREKVVREAISATIGAAKALREIKSYKDGVLWKSEFKSFEAYCSAKWGYQKSHAYRLVESGDFVAQLEAYNLEHSPTRGTVTLPVNESQIRAITAVPKEQRVAAWVAGVGDTAVDTLSGKTITEKVKDYLPPKVARVRATVPVAPPVIVLGKSTGTEEVLHTLEASVGEHPRADEIKTLIVQIKTLLGSATEESTTNVAA
jgi:protein gp37